jgi:hypothetical protein
MKPDTLDTPNEPELAENQFIGRDGNIHTEDDIQHQNLENIDRENPFNL